MRGMVRVWPIDVRDPQFKYVRWCSDFEVVDLAEQQIVGAISKGGKEGHLSEREATAKVSESCSRICRRMSPRPSPLMSMENRNCRPRRSVRRDARGKEWKGNRRQQLINHFKEGRALA